MFLNIVCLYMNLENKETNDKKANDIENGRKAIIELSLVFIMAHS